MTFSYLALCIQVSVMIYRERALLILLVIDSFPKLHYLPMIRETFEVINALSTICLFIATYFYLLEFPGADDTVCYLTVTIVLAGYSTYIW